MGERMEGCKSDLTESEPYVRWAQVRIRQLGYVNNLILGLAVGTLAFETNMVVGHAERLHAGSWWLPWASFLFVLASIFLGLWTGINRLRDFRLTARAYLVEDPKRRELLAVADRLGVMTWHLLYSQIATFFVSIIVAFVWLVGLVAAFGPSRPIVASEVRGVVSRFVIAQSAHPAAGRTSARGHTLLLNTITGEVWQMFCVRDSVVAGEPKIQFRRVNVEGLDSITRR